jgi:polysaccharide deacetylase family protein (PEP-CTERM system associated)
MAPILNAMSVDVEDWFQVQAFAGVIARDAWDGLDRRVEANTDRVLQLFAEAKVRATFFTLGWVAERHPALVRRIVDAGHELASHGYGHELVHVIGAEKFRADVSRAKAVLEDSGGVAVHGYRAPTFSIAPKLAPWAHAVLAETGHGYSSSVFPVRHDLYGAPEAPREPYRPDPNGVLELPMTTVRIGSRNLPCAGGGWFRMFPYALFRTGLARVNAQERLRGMFYFHPWEIDTEQPRVAGAPARSRLRHYSGLVGMQGKLRRLLRDFAWDRVDRVFPEIGLSGSPASSPALAA